MIKHIPALQHTYLEPMLLGQGKLVEANLLVKAASESLQKVLSGFPAKIEWLTERERALRDQGNLNDAIWMSRLIRLWQKQEEETRPKHCQDFSD